MVNIMNQISIVENAFPAVKIVGVLCSTTVSPAMIRDIYILIHVIVLPTTLSRTTLNWTAIALFNSIPPLAMTNAHFAKIKPSTTVWIAKSSQI